MSSNQARPPWFQRKGAAWGLGLLSVLFIGTWLAGRIWNWPWPDGADWQAIWTFFTFLVAAIAAAVALAQLAAHHEAQREQSRPYVIVDFSFRSVLLSIEVKNIGQTPAKDISLAWDVEPRPIGTNNDNQVLKRNLVDGKIPFLAPGRAIRYVVGRAPDYWADDATPKRFEVTASYADVQGHRFGAGEQMILDLAQWAEALADTDYDNKNWNQFKWQTEAQKKIAEELGRIDDRLVALQESAGGLTQQIAAVRRDEQRALIRRNRR